MGHDDDEWEICNDDGFVYKRRRRLAAAAADDEDNDEGPRPLPAMEAADLRRHHRARSLRRRRCLLDLRERYRAELAQWERLSSSLLEPAAPHPLITAADADAGSSAQQLELTDACDGDRYRALFDDLIAQAEAQETSVQKLYEVCYYAESLFKEEEENLVKTLLDLPIWGSPRTLITSLSLD